MNSLRNQIQIIGLLGSTPEMQTTPSGKKYTKFNVATTEKYTTKTGEKKEDTTWHKITLWDRQAEIACQYLAKGKEACFNGKMVNREYVDKDGVKRYTYEIVVADMLLLGGATKGIATTGKPEALVTVEDNLPF